jgi:hypothetical protein
MWKYIGLKQNDVDPSPEARAQFGAAVDFVFKFAEYALVAGVFAYLAKTTQHWAVITIAVVLVLLLTTHLLSLVSGLQYFLWREAENKALKALLFVLDAAIFVGIFYTLQRAFFAVFETMQQGVGI